MKLHLCCGSVYLNEYVNVDIQGLVDSKAPRNPTTLDNYYTEPLSRKPKEDRGCFIVDSKVNLLISWPWRNKTISEIVIIQALEHFLLEEAEHILRESYRVLEPGGKFIFDFPDIERTVLDYAPGNFEMMNRLVYCNHKDEYSVHKRCYSRDSFREMLGKVQGDLEKAPWYKIEFKEIVKHEYPVIGGVATK